MNESFVFKNKKGATCGYIMARGRQLRIRLPEGMEKACLTAVYKMENETLKAVLTVMKRKGRMTAGG